MTSAALFLAVWLMPAVWLEVPALILGHGPDGLWIGLALAMGALVALGVQPAERAGERESLFRVAILLLAVAVLLWANLILAGNVAVWLGAPRWQGIAAAAGAGWLLTAWRGSARLAPILLLIVLIAVSGPLIALAKEAGAGPLAAWARVANREPFRFPARSQWVTAGRGLTIAHGRPRIVFDEDHRVTAPAGGRLVARVQDGDRATDREWTLEPGQSVTLRRGDQLLRSAMERIQFESGKRVPGAPESGIAWAAGDRPSWARAVGLLLTALFGALALLRAGVPAPPMSRAMVAVVAGGLMIALLWGQCKAVYTALEAPDIFLGGIAPERLLAWDASGERDVASSPAQLSLLAGGLASFLASSIALRARLGALDRTGSGEIGHDVGLWAGVFAIAAIAALWPVDVWSLVLLVLGAVGSSLGASTLAPAPVSVATAASLVGLAVFASLALVAAWRSPADGVLGALLAYPALAAVPVSALVLWIGGLAVPR
jgi:hypothetical protein